MIEARIGILLVALGSSASFGQERVYRCGNEYTNATGASQRGDCRVVEGGNVTVIQSSRPRATASPRSSAGSAAPVPSSSPASAPRVSSVEQSNRDQDARSILQAELRRSEEHLANLQNEYNDGSPARSALELRNPQGYIERTAGIKADIERAEADIEGIQREISRLR